MPEEVKPEEIEKEQTAKELKEDELDGVSGGAFDAYLNFPAAPGGHH
jgi:hypothetical protein